MAEPWFKPKPFPSEFAGGRLSWACREGRGPVSRASYTHWSSSLDRLWRLEKGREEETMISSKSQPIWDLRSLPLPSQKELNLHTIGVSLQALELPKARFKVGIFRGARLALTSGASNQKRRGNWPLGLHGRWVAHPTSLLPTHIHATRLNTIWG